jgi:hypothetical protein
MAKKNAPRKAKKVSPREVKSHLKRAATILNHPSLVPGNTGGHFPRGSFAATNIAAKSEIQEVGVYQAYCNTVHEPIAKPTMDNTIAWSEANAHQIQTGHSVTVLSNVQ